MCNNKNESVINTFIDHAFGNIIQKIAGSGEVADLSATNYIKPISLSLSCHFQAVAKVSSNVS